MKRNKRGISLIVLVITIIVMIILAAAVMISLSNTGILNKANDAVDATNLKEIQQIASLAWSEAYLDSMDIKDEETRLANIQAAVDKALENINTDDYDIVVDGKGVTVKKKGLEAGLYDAKGVLLASWNELINDYGVDFEVARNYPGDKSSTALGTIIDNNEELQTAFELRFPENYTEIQPFAFSYCTTLYRVIIPESVTSIGTYAFSSCYNIIEVCNKSALDIVAGENTHGSVAYSAKHITDDEKQTAIKLIDDFAFYDDEEYVALIGYIGNDTEITIPVYEEGTLYEIRSYAFDGCTTLKSIDISEGATNIGTYAFNFCSSLTSVKVPVSVKTICSAVFDGCHYLERINYTGTTSQWNEITILNTVGRLWYSNSAIIEVVCSNGVFPIDHIQYSLSSDGTYYICSGIELDSINTIVIPSVYNGLPVTTIGTGGFSSSSLVTVEIPSSIVHIYQGAFASCTALESVTFKGTVEQWNAITTYPGVFPEGTVITCSDGTVTL